MDQCSLPATSQEQYVTLLNILKHGKEKDILIFTLVQFDLSFLTTEGRAVRLVLSYNGRKGLPVTARIALLDTRYLQYEHAVIGTVLTTLNVGSVVVTFFPNFALSLRDASLESTFKVQIQISGADQSSNCFMATLHHQIVYRLQNHSFDLKN